MAGILDFLNNQSPEQSRGLLAAAAQILQQSGPSRTPQSLGQILGGGINAYYGSMDQQQDRAQQTRMRDLQIKNAESDLAAQEAQRQRAQNLLSLTAAYGKQRGGQQQPMAPVDRSGAAMFQGLMAGASPSMAAPGEHQPMTASAPQGGAGGGRGALVQQRLEYAQYLRDNGYTAEANAAEEQALKLQPKVDTWNKVNVGGKTLYAPYFSDGTTGDPVPLEVAQNLERVNAGGTTELINPSTGESVRSIKNSASPDALVAAETQRRAQAITMRGQDFENERSIRANPANKPLPAPALKMQQDGLEKLTTATGINTQLADIRSQITNGTLSFGPVKNLMNQGLNAAGISTDGSRAFANFRVTLEKLRNDSLRLNTGVQTDGDAQREWNALFQNINDTKWVAQRLEAIEKLNERGAELQKLNIDGIRGNYGHSPLDYTPYSAVIGGQPTAQQPPGGGKTVTLADITETARKSGRTTAEVTAALKAKGYTIGGR